MHFFYGTPLVAAFQLLYDIHLKFITNKQRQGHGTEIVTKNILMKNITEIILFALGFVGLTNYMTEAVAQKCSMKIVFLKFS